MSLIIQNVHLYWIDQGSGPPTLFLHGNPDSADLWKGVISKLCSNFRCLAPDLPGFGRSVAPNNFDCSLENMARFMDELVQAVGVTEPLNLVVHDFGGPFGLAWAVKYPAKVRTIVIINSVFSSKYRWHAWARIWRTPIVGEISMLLLNRWIFTRAVQTGSRKLPSEHIHQTFSLITPAMKRMVLRLYRSIDPENFKGWEEQLLALTSRVPTLVLWGDRDPYISKKFAECFGARQVQHFPDCGHWLPVEAADAIAQQMLNFFGSLKS